MNQMTTENRVKVWDPLVRLFHWTLVISFAVAYLSGDEMDQLHLYAGYVITGLLVFRLVWGFVGSRHARFSDFVRPPGEVIDYLKSLFSGHPKRYLGHNPAGGVMVILLLVSLAGTVGTGLVMDPAFGGGGMEGAAGQSSMAMYEDDDDDDDEDDEDERYEGRGENEVVEELHEVLANLTLFLVFLHIAGVVVSSRLHRENLVRAMITGYKPKDPEL